MDWTAEGTYPGAALGFGLVDPYDTLFCESNPTGAMFVYREVRRVCLQLHILHLRDFSSATASCGRVSMYSSQSLLCLAAQRGNDHYMTALSFSILMFPLRGFITCCSRIVIGVHRADDDST